MKITDLWASQTNGSKGSQQSTAGGAAGGGNRRGWKLEKSESDGKGRGMKSEGERGDH
jgi:hypothetical protein